MVAAGAAQAAKPTERSKQKVVVEAERAQVQQKLTALKRSIAFQVLNEYRGAISALNSGAPMMYTKPDSPLGRSFQELARAIDKTQMTRVATVR